MEGCTLTPATWRAVPTWDQCHGAPRATMIRNSTVKVVFRAYGVSELYLLTNDPRELKNLYGDPSVAALQADLLRRVRAAAAIVALFALVS